MDADIVGAGDRWIPDREYQFIRAKVPIVCVDVLLSPGNNPQLVGLIHRETYDGGVGWCLVGGSVLRNESALDAVERHVIATLGDGLKIDRSSLELRTVAEYFTDPAVGDLYDPRKHAVSLTYIGFCEGTPQPKGEASEFRWFGINSLADVEFGFGQGEVVARLLRTPALD